MGSLKKVYCVPLEVKAKCSQEAVEISTKQDVLANLQ